MTEATVMTMAVGGLEPVSLETVLDLASLQTRTDRKYVVGPGVFADLIGALGSGMAALDIDGDRSFRYESVYFDTPDLDCYFAAAHGRRRRAKVRTRRYLDSGACSLEVKTRGGREETVKHRMPYDAHDSLRLTAAARDFVRDHANVADVRLLAPVLTTSYRRATLVDLVAGTRLTCDAGLVCASAGGAVSLPEHLLVETKGAGGPGAADRFLWRAGCRPATVSKYCVGMAALDPRLPANRWNLTLRRYLGWAPDR